MTMLRNLSKTINWAKLVLQLLYQINSFQTRVPRVAQWARIY
jgi:hypothetical protein